MKTRILVSTALLGMVVSMSSMACKSMADRVCSHFGKYSDVCKEYQRVCGGRTLKTLDGATATKLNGIVKDKKFRIEIEGINAG